jgi:hypothetical protein
MTLKALDIKQLIRDNVGQDLFCHNLKTRATTLKEITALFHKERKERNESHNIEIVAFGPLDWGEAHGGVAQGWIKVIYKGDQ